MSVCLWTGHAFAAALGRKLKLAATKDEFQKLINKTGYPKKVTPKMDNQMGGNILAGVFAAAGGAS